VTLGILGKYRNQLASIFASLLYDFFFASQGITVTPIKQP
jgi:hypothetical protein